LSNSRAFFKATAKVVKKTDTSKLFFHFFLHLCHLQPKNKRIFTILSQKFARVKK